MKLFNPLFRSLCLVLGLSLGGQPLRAAVLPAGPATPVKIIFDTDMGNDCDDAMALAVIHALQNRAACELLAVTLTNPDPLAGRLVDAINTFYGRPDIPIGVNPSSPSVVKISKYLRVAETHPHDFDPAKAPGAVALLRKTLAAAADGEIVIVQVGFFTNLAALLDSPADEYSPLLGRELVRRKVRELSLMAGQFSPAGGSNYYSEFNVRYDVPSAVKVAAEWPTPAIWSGMEIGNAVLFPAHAVDRDFAYVASHPVQQSYQLYKPTPHERPCFDLTSVVHAVWPDRGYFELSLPGQVEVLPDGFTKFIAAKGKESRRDRYMLVDRMQALRVRELLAALVTEAPARK